MNVYLNGFDRKEVTFNAGAGISEGKAVNFLNKSTVGASAAGSKFCGVCSTVRSGMASVVLRGYVTVSYTGTAPSLGYNKIVADGSGGIKLGDDGRDILVADVDAAKKTCGIIL